MPNMKFEMSLRIRLLKLLSMCKKSGTDPQPFDLPFFNERTIKGHFRLLPFSGGLNPIFFTNVNRLPAEKTEGFRRRNSFGVMTNNFL